MPIVRSKDQLADIFSNGHAKAFHPIVWEKGGVPMHQLKRECIYAVSSSQQEPPTRRDVSHFSSYWLCHKLKLSCL